MAPVADPRNTSEQIASYPTGEANLSLARLQRPFRVVGGEAHPLVDFVFRLKHQEEPPEIVGQPPFFATSKKKQLQDHMVKMDRTWKGTFTSCVACLTLELPRDLRVGTSIAQNTAPTQPTITIVFIFNYTCLIVNPLLSGLHNLLDCALLVFTCFSTEGRIVSDPRWRLMCAAQAVEGIAVGIKPPTGARIWVRAPWACPWILQGVHSQHSAALTMLAYFR